jgi:hypothetical protein
MCFGHEEEAMSLVKSDRFNHYAGWAAYASAVLAVVGFVFLFLLYYYALQPHASAPGGASALDFGHINDILGLVASLCMLPLPVALHALTGYRRPKLSWVAMALGVLGLLTTSIAQALLIAQVITFETNLPFSLIGLALLGAWLILANHLGRAAGTLSRWLGWLGELNGIALVILAVGVVLLVNLSGALTAGGTFQQYPALVGVVIALVIPGALAYFLGFPIWLIGLGRRLLDPPMTPALSSQRPASVSAP